MKFCYSGLFHWALESWTIEIWKRWSLNFKKDFRLNLFLQGISTSLFLNDLFLRNDQIFLITESTPFHISKASYFDRKIYEVFQKNGNVFIEFSRRFPHIERHLIFPQYITYQENEAFDIYPQYVHFIQDHVEYDIVNLSWSSINLPFEIQDKRWRCFWIFRI